MTVSTLGVDLAKTSFSIYGVDRHGKPVIHKTLTRAKLLAYIANLPLCTIGMEACSGAHYWERVFRQLGHTVHIMAPSYVALHRTGAKNDLSG